MRGYGIPPIAEEEERTPGATLEVDEIRRGAYYRHRNGSVIDLSVLLPELPSEIDLL